MMIKLKDFRKTIGAPPFCKHAGSPLLPNAPNIPNCGLVLKLARYRVSRALEASLHTTEASLAVLSQRRRVSCEILREPGGVAANAALLAIRPKLLFNLDGPVFQLVTVAGSNC